MRKFQLHTKALGLRHAGKHAGLRRFAIELIFLLVGAAMVLALPPPLAAPRLGVLMAALASEFVQFWVPGRTPLWADVGDDLLGGAVGVLLGVLVSSAWGRWRAPTR